MSTTETTTTESLEEFTARVREWAEETMTPAGRVGTDDDRLGKWMADNGRDPDDMFARARAILRLSADAGFGGLVFPPEYGGHGLPPTYLRAFNAGVEGFDLTPTMQFVLSIGMNGPGLLEFGTEEQKQKYLPRILDGTDLWIQFLSEPTGGSDLASTMTRADRDGDEWIVNGSKIWTSLATEADMGMCLVRTNWDVPKHRGMSVLMIPMDAPGLEIQPLRLVSGQTGFCQEFFTDVRLPADALLGDVDDGWTVASRLLVHERNALNGGSDFFIPPMNRNAPRAARTSSGRDDLVELAERRGDANDSHTRQLVAEAYALSKVTMQTAQRVTMAMARGTLPPAASSILKLSNTESAIRRSDITMALSGTRAVVWEDGDRGAEMQGVGFLSRQSAALISGTSEIQRNIVSERMLGLPREPALDRELPFSEVRHNTMPTGR